MHDTIENKESKEENRPGEEITSQLRIKDLFVMKSIIDAACLRGGIRAPEMVVVGEVYQRLTGILKSVVEAGKEAREKMDLSNGEDVEKEITDSAEKTKKMEEILGSMENTRFQISVKDLAIMKQIVDGVSKRGKLKPNEMKIIGDTYGRIEGLLEQVSRCE